MDCIGVIFGRVVTRSVYATLRWHRIGRSLQQPPRMDEQMRPKHPRAARRRMPCYLPWINMRSGLRGVTGMYS